MKRIAPWCRERTKIIYFTKTDVINIRKAEKGYEIQRERCMRKMPEKPVCL